MKVIRSFRRMFVRLRLGLMGSRIVKLVGFALVKS